MLTFQLGAAVVLLSSFSSSSCSVNSSDGADSHCRLGPENPSAQPGWLQDLKDERTAVQKKIGWTGGVSANPSIKWSLTSYIQPQMHPYDRLFYDPEAKEYTVSKFLDDLKARYGGIDAMLIWPTYPHTGIDDRNQFDFFRALPGGLDGVAKLVRELHEAGVKVLQPNKPWDTGTRKEPLDNAETLAAMLKKTGADGLNGDTMDYFDKEFWDASVAVQHPLAFEPEDGGTDAALSWTTMGWSHHWDMLPRWANTKIPVVDRFKFISEGKFMTNMCNRWARDRINDLQNAWFNGDGYESWENVWGTWNGITPKDGEAIRRVATMLRFFGKEGFLQTSDWEPHALGLTHTADVFASKWTLQEGVPTVHMTRGLSGILWTIVNRGDQDLTPQLWVDLSNLTSEVEYYDCYHGTQLFPEANGTLSFHIEKFGFGCVLQTPKSSPGGEFRDFLAGMQELAKTPLASYDNIWQYLQQTMVEIPQVGFVTSAPQDTVFVDKAWFAFESSGVEIEGNSDQGVDVQYPWEEHPTKHHNQTLQLGPFYIDKFPVTAAKYSAYLQDTGYQPADSYNWLKTWNGSSQPPAEVAELPVTYVSLDEARAYCAWAGGRLPHSYEWQYAAQGTDHRLYPWGSQKDQSNYPVLTTGNTYFGPESVTAHSPAGDSPFGMSDVVGNVWQYTDEFQDAHTRSVILKGGSNYRPSGIPGNDHWYFPQALELNKHEKYMLMDESYERAGTIGFRCLVDAADETNVFV